MRRSFDALEPLYPTTEELHRAAVRHLPRFVVDYIDGGSGADAATARNRRAFDGMALTPRYGRGVVAPEMAVTLLGQAYSAPFGIAPMGLGALVRPRLEERLGALPRPPAFPMFSRRRPAPASRRSRGWPRTSSGFSSSGCRATSTA